MRSSTRSAFASSKSNRSNCDSRISICLRPFMVSISWLLSSAQLFLMQKSTSALYSWKAQPRMPCQFSSFSMTIFSSPKSLVAWIWSMTPRKRSCRIFISASSCLPKKLIMASVAATASFSFLPCWDLFGVLMPLVFLATETFSTVCSRSASQIHMSCWSLLLPVSFSESPLLALTTDLRKAIAELEYQSTTPAADSCSLCWQRSSSCFAAATSSHSARVRLSMSIRGMPRRMWSAMVGM
mmetsp:Transcript_77603/g.199809  ORF Transcript_77603/g.199809 Transcript_77603/m.199809 type:complete len:240 (+) Transcript_77603:565-1284(+)